MHDWNMLAVRSDTAFLTSHNTVSKVTKIGSTLPLGRICLLGNPDSSCTVYNISFVTLIKTNNALFDKKKLISPFTIFHLQYNGLH
jgi:hypothetical protein